MRSLGCNFACVLFKNVGILVELIAIVIRKRAKFLGPSIEHRDLMKLFLNILH